MSNQQLIETEKYFLAIADTTNDMIHLNDSEGRIVYANNATETILGYQLNEIINTHAFEIIHPEDREAIKNDMLSISTDNQLAPRDIRLLKKDSSYVDVEVRGFIVALDENKYLGAIIRDISKRKKKERELTVYRNNLEQLVQERTEKLEKAIREIKTLRGMLSICSNCQRIKGGKGAWNILEHYIRQNSDLKFTHTICPDCIRELYPDLADGILADYDPEK